jgi:aminoglycoside phosphotransferase (APT) family kinase protein
MVAQSPLPDEVTAAKVFRSHFSEPVSAVTRFPTGLRHHVYEIRTSTGGAYVVRIASSASRPDLEGGLYWHPRLRAAGVPVPVLYASSVTDEYPYMLIERLPGSDLGQVYAGLSSAAKQALAVRIAAIQKAVSALPMPRGFGFAHSYEQADAQGKRSWAEVVAADIARSEERIHRIGRIEQRYVERVRAVLTDYETYLQSVRPVPFLDDMTTKNVIVNEGTLSGIVDTDEVCFGDPLFTLGITNMALLSLGMDTDYVGYWLNAIGVSRQQRAIVAGYSLVFCLGFMSELGQVFNQPVEYSEGRAQNLRDIFEQLMKALVQ